ncbi:putative ABC transport system permease protein [Lachnospiraceae bacterium PF1-21]|uniref:ABC transporter permease n=1 Tax=Ohessyouella blattaphilus TaxID=2949333 RepID=UPI003E2FDF6A
MKMTTRVAYDNMKYYKSRNILVGIAVILTTLLLFVVPTVGKGMIDLQFAATNKLYPSWHALYRGVDKKTTEELAAHKDISKYGLRSDAGSMNVEGASVSLTFLDQGGMDLYKLKLAKGELPQAVSDIVVSKGILKALGQAGDIGDTITVPYQIYRNGELDFTEEKEFRITGFFEDSTISQEEKAYTALVSEAFIQQEIPEEQIVYRFLLQIDDAGRPTTTEIEERVKLIAAKFDIPENETNINSEYLLANYVDPTLIPGIAMIMLIIVVAGVITIYSIYYVSMKQRVQEFGRLKAIGATKRQIKQIVLREGFCIAALATPIGLILGTLLSQTVLFTFAKSLNKDGAFQQAVSEIIKEKDVSFIYWWAYLLAIVVTFTTVYFSLVRPMRTAAKVSEVEAMRMQGTGKKRSERKGFSYLTIGRLTRRNLTDNKKKSVITICSMAITGVFLMVVATVIACANPRESANSTLVGQYEIMPMVEENNKEHPEYKWSMVQQDNPLNQELRQQIEQLDGVKRVDEFTTVLVTGEIFGEGGMEMINGIPEEYKEELEKGITEGSVTYEELKSGDKVIIDRTLLYWFPNLRVGDKLKLTIHDGEQTYTKEVEISAIGEYGSGMTNYAYLIMAKEAADKLCQYNNVRFYHILADKDYDKDLEASLKQLVRESGRIEMRTWQEEYESWKSSMTLTSGACYAFLGILGLISVMNLINTMINSVYVRKKELGMMQAIGMSDSQLMKMLQLEGLFYTLGTLIITIGLGSLAGYPVFLVFKTKGLFEITTYHYPLTVALVVSGVLLIIQILLAIGISKSVRKDSLIERIRFSD